MAACLKVSRNGLAVFCSKQLSVVKTLARTKAELLEGNKSAVISRVPIPNSPQITCMGTSHSGGLLGVCTDDKNLFVWKMDCLDLLVQKPISKRAVAVCFSHSNDVAMVADKSGDVWSFKLNNPDAEPKLLLGHVSMLFDMVVTRDDRYLITCDRDEKIRVSHFPNAYNIHGFCLGHTDLVSKLCLCSGSEEWLVSGAADGTIVLWDFMSGEMLDRVLFPEDPVVTGLAYSRAHNVLVASHDGSPNLFCYRISREGKFLPCGEYNTGSEVCHFEYDPDDCLWALLGSQKHPIVTLQWANDKFVPMESQFCMEAAEVLESSGVLEGVEKAVPDFSELRKREYDNVSLYLQRKEVRTGNKS